MADADDPVCAAAADLCRWLKIATGTEVRDVKASAGLPAVTLGLITEHDQQNTTRVRSQPRSAPPWNPAVANAVLDANSGVRQLEQHLHVLVTGRPMAAPRLGTDAAIYQALDRIPALAVSAPHGERAAAVRLLTRWATAIRQLPAIDDAPVWEKIRPGPDGLPPICPYCDNYSLAVAVQSGQVMCRFPGCTDANGDTPQARMDIGQVSAEYMVYWNDGHIQVAP